MIKHRISTVVGVTILFGAVSIGANQAFSTCAVRCDIDVRCVSGSIAHINNTQFKSDCVLVLNTTSNDGPDTTLVALSNERRRATSNEVCPIDTSFEPGQTFVGLHSGCDSNETYYASDNMCADGCESGA
jgi:hypothetical protein